MRRTVLGWVIQFAALAVLMWICWLLSGYRLADVDILAVTLVAGNILAALAVAGALYWLVRWARRRV